MDNNPYQSPPPEPEGAKPIKKKSKQLQLPLWSAYIIAPLFVLASGWKVYRESNDPIRLAAIMFAGGFACAVIFHLYVIVRKRLSKD